MALLEPPMIAWANHSIGRNVHHILLGGSEYGVWPGLSHIPPGPAAQTGVEVVWPEGSDQACPAENEWREAAGALAEYTDSQGACLHVTLDSLTAQTEPGSESVSQQKATR